MRKTSKSEDNLIIFLIGLCFSQFPLVSIGLSSIASLMFYLSFMVLFACWIIPGIKLNDEFNMIIIISFILCAISILFNVVLENGPLGLGHLEKIIFYISVLIMYKVSLQKFDVKRIQNWLSVFAIIISLFYIALYFLMYDQMHILHDTVSDYLTFNLGNPNKTGLFLLIVAISNLLLVALKKQFLWKLVHLILTVFNFYFIVETKSRNALIAFFIFTVLFIFALLRKRRFKVPVLVNLVVAIFPFVFALIYLRLVNNSALMEFFSFLAEDGKNLDSRVGVWEDALALIKDNLLFGAITQVSGGSGLFQLHNTHIDILAAFGIVPFILFIMFVTKLLNRLSNTPVGRYGFIYYCAFAATTFLGIFEAAAYNGANGIGILSAVFVLLSYSSQNNEPG